MKKSFLVIFILCSALFRSAFAEMDSPVKQLSYSAILSLTPGTPDIVLRYGKAQLQFIEGWQTQSQEVSADIIFIHGGCWLSTYDITHSRTFTKSLSEAGFQVWSLEYRRTGDEGGGWPGSFEDIKTGINYLINNKHIKTEKIILMGHSAGGHLALLAASKLSEKVHGVIGLAAIADLHTYAKGSNSCQSATQQFMGGSPQEKAVEYKVADPKLQPKHNNTWLMFSEQDAIVPASQVQGWEADGAQLLKVSDAGHFDFIHPQSIAWQAIISTLNKAIK